MPMRGIETVTLCGGEPLQYEHIEEAIELLAGLNIRIYLYTALGAGFVNKLKGIIPRLYGLSLPLDSIREDTLEYFGRADSARSVISFLHEKYIPSSCHLKVGTVVTKRNIGELESIGKFLTGIAPQMNVWRLYQYSPYKGIKKEISENLTVEDGEFANEIERLRKRFPLLTISSRSNSETSGYCILMDSMGDLYRYDNSYIRINKDIFSINDNELVENYDMEKNTRQKKWHES
jgi:MoaA/NifB/PqqE/SkfB family radical SAM enzyme